MYSATAMAEPQAHAVGAVGALRPATRHGELCLVLCAWRKLGMQTEEQGWHASVCAHPLSLVSLYPLTVSCGQVSTSIRWDVVT